MFNDIYSYIGAIIYPPGSYYISVKDINPEELYGGTWEQIHGKMLFSNSSEIDYNENDGHFDTWLSKHYHNNTHYHTANSDSHQHFLGGRADTVTSGSAYHRPRWSTYDSDWWYVPSATGHSHSVNYNMNNTSTVGITPNGTTSSSFSITDGNLPPYRTVNIWRRISL